MATKRRVIDDVNACSKRPKILVRIPRSVFDRVQVKYDDALEATKVAETSAIATTVEVEHSTQSKKKVADPAETNKVADSNKATSCKRTGHGGKRRAGHGGRYFAAGTWVEPEVHYFVKPDVEVLSRDLYRGKYCLLTGHRQSGKTTSVRYVAGLLEENGYLPVTLWRGLLGASSDWSMADMWLQLCKFLHLASPQHFPPVERGRPWAYNSDDFVEAFNARALKVPVVLIIDESDTFLELKEECIDEFLHTVRLLMSTPTVASSCGPTYNLWTMLLVGTDRVKELGYHNATKQPGYEPTYLSCPHNYALSAVRFKLEDIEALLQQFANDFRDLGVEVREVAESIYQLTAGHKGLTGTCLAFMDQEAAYTLKTWNNLAINGSLVTHVFSLPTYARVMQAVRESGSRKLKQQLKKFVEHAHIRYFLVNFDDNLVRDYLASGVLTLEVDAPDCYLKLSSPLLRMAILGKLSIRNFSIEKRPLRDTLQTEDDRVWVLATVIELLDGKLVRAPEVLLINNDTPSEYSYQFAFMARLKVVLEQAYPAMLLEVLTEVREVRVPGKQRSLLRADTLVVNGGSFRPFAVEFLVFGTLGINGTLRKHYNKALVYAQQHAAVVYLINITLDSRANELVPDSSDVVFVGVEFTTGLDVAKVKMVYSSGLPMEFSLNLKRWTGELDYQWSGV